MTEVHIDNSGKVGNGAIFVFLPRSNDRGRKTKNSWFFLVKTTFSEGEKVVCFIAREKQGYIFISDRLVLSRRGRWRTIHRKRGGRRRGGGRGETGIFP